MTIQQSVSRQSKTILWTGRILFWLCSLFFLMDAIMKVFKEAHHVEGTIKFGYPAYCVQLFGGILLVSTILYMVPRTAILGAILLTAYLGGATATMVRAEEPVYFSIVFGILTWAALYLRDEKLRALFPFRH